MIVLFYFVKIKIKSKFILIRWWIFSVLVWIWSQFLIWFLIFWFLSWLLYVNQMIHLFLFIWKRTLIHFWFCRWIFEFIKLHVCKLIGYFIDLRCAILICFFKNLHQQCIYNYSNFNLWFNISKLQHFIRWLLYLLAHTHQH